MQPVKERLKKLKYQILKEQDGDWSPQQKIPMVQSIYDSAIDLDSPDMSGDVFPTEALGLTLIWSADNRTLTIDGGEYEIIDDDLTDEITPTIDDQLITGAFQTNGEFFYINNEIFELQTA